MLSRVPYPLEKGDKLRAFHQLRSLSKKHEIILIAMSDGPIHPKALEKLKPYCKEIHIFPLSLSFRFFNLFRAVTRGIPFQVGYFYHKHYQHLFDKLFERTKPDVIYCQLIRMAEYLRKKQKYKDKAVIDYMDAFSKGMLRRLSIAKFWQAPFLVWEYKRLIRYEEKVFSWFNQRVVISEQDRMLIPHSMREQIHVIPNGVNTQYFKPNEIEKIPFSILFTGNMGYPPNVDAALTLVNEVLPLVQKRIPEAYVVLAGASPDKSLQQLASDSVTVTGWVDDIRSCYAIGSVFVAPLKIGTGLQNKLLEAMAMGTPCITTSLCNSALGAKADQDVLVADTVEEFANKILDLFYNSEMAAKLSQNGRAFVEKNYEWDAANEKLEKILSSVVHN